MINKTDQIQPPYFFAYGTLWTGTGHTDMDDMMHRCCIPLDRGYIQARLYDLGEFPGAVRSDRVKDKVYGMVFKLRQPEQSLMHLDRYEGFELDNPEGSVFVRSLVKVVPLSKKQAIQAWVYYYNRSITHRLAIKSGDYSRSRH